MFKENKLLIYSLLAIIVLLLVFQFKNCFSKKAEESRIVESVTTCDTLWLTKTDTVTRWIPAILPEPKIVYVDRIVEVVKLKTDSVFIQQEQLPEPKIGLTVENVPLYTYDSTVYMPSYELRWHIESYGELKVFHHALTPKFEIRQTTTNNITTNKDERKFILFGEAMAISELDKIEPEYFAGLGLMREWKRGVLGVRYNRQLIKDNAKSALSIMAGVRF